jgi:chromosomal replication initiation ATPase DnaA
MTVVQHLEHATPQARADSALRRYALHVAATLADAAERRDHDAIRSILGRAPEATQPEPIEAAVERAAAHLGVTVAGITGRGRCRELVDARAVVCYTSWLLGYSSVATGRRLGGRDHSTVLAAITRVAGTPRLRCLAEQIARGLGWDREVAS